MVDANVLTTDLKATKEVERNINGVEIVADFMKYAVLVSVSIFTAFPFIWMFLSALKSKEEIMNVMTFLPAQPQWENFAEILFDSPILSYIGNSLWVSLIVIVLQIVTGAMLTYAMVFLEFKGRNILFAVVMGTYMLPVAATYIPSYIILSKWNLLNTTTGLVISSCVSIFGIFLLRQAFMQVPKGLVEAARMDGASHFRILWEIICPMTKSAFITFGLMSFISTYNNYMWPSLITNDSTKFLVSQGLRSFFIEGGAYGTKWNLVMAASAVIVIPLLILFAFTQKWFINGIGGDTGMKG
ncbi:MAG: carbohydrate ABC transporter permease [Lachnospiraceae bacterium]|nr:carbohydrate ABC transporter permease [Lachnospiraceae bacterium]